MPMDTKDKTFQMRLTKQELEDLHVLADRAGISASDYLRSHIRRDAKRKKIRNFERGPK